MEFLRRNWIVNVGVVAISGLLLASCDFGGSEARQEEEQNCTIDPDQFREAAERGSFPFIERPEIVRAGSERASEIRADERVIALLVEGTALAIPHSVIDHFEILNLESSEWQGGDVAITYCPLTGSSLAFSREAVDGVQFEVSGLLLHDNLVMVDRQAESSLWSQMKGSAVCGAQAKTGLEEIPVLDVRWSYWQNRHPDSRVVVGVKKAQTAEQGHPQVLPDRTGLAAPISRSTDIPRGLVLGIPGAGGSRGGGGVPKVVGGPGLAFPFQSLSSEAPVRVVDAGPNLVVFWNDEARGAMAYRTSASFTVQNGMIVDDATGSQWALDGRAVSGPRAGEQLPPVASAYVALGDAWVDFHPETDVWRPSP